jgi:hypothetical protein
MGLPPAIFRRLEVEKTTQDGNTNSYQELDRGAATRSHGFVKMSGRAPGWKSQERGKDGERERHSSRAGRRRRSELRGPAWGIPDTKSVDS